MKAILSVVLVAILCSCAQPTMTAKPEPAKGAAPKIINAGIYLAGTQTRATLENISAGMEVDTYVTIDDPEMDACSIRICTIFPNGHESYRFVELPSQVTNPQRYLVTRGKIMFSSGEYHMDYKATDRAGNFGDVFPFMIKVK